ncbi:histone deacetylase complex subunit SAP18 [Strongylocentrotus purpuratus]|uniref:18 kDa Sin3-associated polypeptide n=1 Tax=Strongylocentrotus purpuratus TaxID=7668 RepID=A0A7M7RFZ7_STRPU|nr:histone deacetylase complex subunit SAP18 [Strongylocentrotus purpuratus]|eukprot:XP_784248.2 PREDICTED: histone deacetylase complex subunit SAP18 [Strongylocentrotus purpuratus]
MASHVVSRITEVDNKPPAPENPIDREKTCPLLLRVFCSNNRHHQEHEFSRGTVPANELQIYTWMDATLKELSSLVKEVNPDARRRGTYFDFAIVHPHPRRNQAYQMREIGMTCSGRKGPDDSVTLGSQSFTIGDYIDIAITLPPRGGLGGGEGGGMGGGGRMGGGGGMGGGGMGMGRRGGWGR